jgi:hypothetical protein
MSTIKTGRKCLVLYNLIIVKPQKEMARRLSIELSIPQNEFPVKKKDNLFVTELIHYSNSMLKTFTAFVHQKGRYVQLPDIERGHFYTNESYIFLCVYELNEDQDLDMTKISMERKRSEERSLPTVFAEKKRTEEFELSDNNVNSEQESNTILKCIVYFWQGRNSSRLAFSTFKFTTLLEMETLIEKMYDCPIIVEYINQHEENFFLLSHMENLLVYHIGSRKIGTQTLHNTKVYHIRKDLRYNTLRAIEIYMLDLFLISNDYFFIHTGETDYLWVGSLASREELNDIQEVLDMVQSLEIDFETPLPEITVLKESHETELFWSVLQDANDINNKEKPIIKDMKPMVIDSSRFILCSARQGFFTMVEKYFFTQTNLSDDSTAVILTPYINYCWFGSHASQLVINKCIKYATMDGIAIEKNVQGEESDEFKAYFHGFDSNRRKKK